MLDLIGSVNDNFAIFATPLDKDRYSVMVYPEMTKEAQEVAVSTAKLRAFLVAHMGSADAGCLLETADVFIHSLTEAEVKELTGGVVGQGKRSAAA